MGCRFDVVVFWGVRMIEVVPLLFLSMRFPRFQCPISRFVVGKSRLVEI